MTTWKYFAGDVAPRSETLKLASDGYICRTIHTVKGTCIPNVKNVMPNDHIILIYTGKVLGTFIVQKPPNPILNFPAISLLPATLSQYLKMNSYKKDPILQQYTGFYVKITDQNCDGLSFKQVGQTTIQKLID